MSRVLITFILGLTSLVLMAEEEVPFWAITPEWATTPDYSVEPEYSKQPGYSYLPEYSVVPPYLAIFGYLLEGTYLDTPGYTKNVDYLKGYGYLLPTEYIRAGEVLGEIIVRAGIPELDRVNKYSPLGIQLQLINRQGKGKYPYLENERHKEKLIKLYREIKEAQERADRFQDRRTPVKR